MAGKYDHLDRDTLIRLLERRDAERRFGLVWERDEEKVEQDRAINSDYVALDLDPSLSHGEGPWPNLIIEGDNYDALRALRATHKGRVRCIYIDPPYNTGNNDFVYNDRFVDKNHAFRHSLWLDFMHKRLQVAKDLLTDDGVIFVSIDENEFSRLSMLLESVFGEQNKVGTIVWKNVTDNNPSRVVTEHEYILCFSRRMEKCPPEWKSPELAIKSLMESVEKEILTEDSGTEEKRNKYAEWFKLNKDQLSPLDNYKYFDEGGIYAGSRSVHNPGKEGYRYDVHHPTTGKPCKQPLMGYRFPEETMKSLLKEGRILFGEDHKKLIELKIYLRDYKKKLSSLIDLDGRSGANEIRSIFGEKVFNNPKPVSLIKEILSFSTRGEDIILDFFAGSGTTAHAIAKLNAEDGGNRRFILVSNTEATPESPEKNLCRDVCAERVRRVMAGYRNGKGERIEGLGGSFAYLRARRVPRHRLNQKLTHGEIWNALELSHQLDVSPWPDCGYATRHLGGGLIAYLADFRSTHVEALLSSIGTAPAAAAITLYSWAPDRAISFLPDANHQPIPQFLRDRFGNEASA